MSNKKINLHHGDMLQILQQLPNNSIDGVITDPPYNSGGGQRTPKQSTKNKYCSTGLSLSDFADFEGDNKDQRGLAFWMSIWLGECYRIAKPHTPICVFTDWRQLPTMTDVLQASGFIWEGIFVWDKKNARPAKGKFKQQTEFVIWGSKKGLKRDREVGYLKGIENINPQQGGRFHQTSKPLDLMTKIIEIVEPGGTILDPFMGSGSTGVAAKEGGYSFTGIEVTKEYYEVAKGRMGMADE